MKITITLSEAEVKGIKDYLKEVDGIEKPTKKDIQRFIVGMADVINAPQEAVSDYIQKYQ